MRRCLVALILLAVCSLFAQEVGNPPESVLSVLDSFLPAEQRMELLEQGHLIRLAYNKETNAPQLVPLFTVPQAFVKKQNTGNAAFLMEALYFYKKPRDNVKVKDIEKISRILRSVSKLEGLQYYSSSRKKMRTLYEKSYIIEDLKTETRIADPVDSSAEDFSVYVLQKDLTFGKNIYRYRFCLDADSTGFLSTNVNAIKYSIFKAIDPEHFELSIAVTDLGEYLLTYMLTQADFSVPSFLHNKVQNSFRTRGEAVYNWFIGQYEKTLTP